MNINHDTSMPPPYGEWSYHSVENILLRFHWIDTKINDPPPTEYYRQTQYSSPPIQQVQPLYVGNSMIVASGAYPMACNCPHCHQSIVTRVERNNGLVVWLAAGGLCLFGFICGCCLIPFCINDLKVWKSKYMYI